MMHPFEYSMPLHDECIHLVQMSDEKLGLQSSIYIVVT